MKWVCSLCGTVAHSKCVDERSIFVETPEELTDIAYFLIKATTSVEMKKNEKDDQKQRIECSIEARTVESLGNIIKEIAKCPAVLTELLCDHRWQLDGDDCTLHCGSHVKLGSIAPVKRALPTVDDVVSDIESYKNLYKRAKVQVADARQKACAVRAIKALFDKHVLGLTVSADGPVVVSDENVPLSGSVVEHFCESANRPTWNENAVKIERFDEQFGSYKFSYDNSGVCIEYLKRVTWCQDDCDSFVDASVEINREIVYKEVKDEVIINKSAST